MFVVSGCLAANISAALRGPIVWLLEGPRPIRYSSRMDFMVLMIYRTVVYQMVTRFSLGMNIGSDSWMPKASYQASMCGIWPLTRHMPSW